MTIVVVEDDANLREALIRKLSRIPELQLLGSAEDAPQAIATIQDLKPDLVTLDLSLAKGSGLEVLAQINRMPRKPIVLVLTGDPDNKTKSYCLAAGANYFFDKSHEFAKALETIKGLLAPAQS